ncbi:DNA primase [Novosphingobium chloroacetimidivorans]|uniref:DNA primase n=1 Tax=Novosphingobium chloroacetimidivorans TaxID=1428314 RepID=A0A7W7K6J6_9SPHN|nr:CHC2 zinc finger domain-containing protein [Novosphingobium chloroacetimidivorans]MBB4857177.1 DNA primase [Novosphingobium chloroacetimidivorans]
MGSPAKLLPESEFRDFVERARDRHLLSHIVGRHTELKKRGARELVGLCPFHSERTPSFEVNDGKGTYHCHGCGKGGDAITFLVEQEGMRFREAVEVLLGEEFPVISEEERAQRKAEDEAMLRARVDLAREMWSRSVPAPGTLAEVYARSRGITAPLPATIRFGGIPRYINLQTGEVGREYPAVVCALQDAAGAVTGVQNIYLRADGAGKYESPRGGKAKLTFGSIVGSAMRLGPVASHIVAVEGPEDGWTLMQRLPDKSVWAACGTALLSRIDWPAEVQSVCFAGDNNAAGRKAVEEARDAALARGLRPGSAFPPEAYKDWNDELRGVAA